MCVSLAVDDRQTKNVIFCCFCVAVIFHERKNNILADLCFHLFGMCTVVCVYVCVGK